MTEIVESKKLFPGDLRPGDFLFPAWIAKANGTLAIERATLIISVEKVVMDDYPAASKWFDVNDPDLAKKLGIPPPIAGNIGYKLVYFHGGELIENFWGHQEMFTTIGEADGDEMLLRLNASRS